MLLSETVSQIYKCIQMEAVWPNKDITESRLFECVYLPERLSLFLPSGYLYFSAVHIKVSQLVSWKFPWRRHFVITYGDENISDNDERTLRLIHSQSGQTVKERFFGFIWGTSRLKTVDIHLLCDQRVSKCCDFMPVIYVKSRKNHFLHLQTDALHLQYMCYTSIKTNWYEKTREEEEEESCDKVLLYGGGLGGMWEECVDVLKWQWEIMKGSS